MSKTPRTALLERYLYIIPNQMVSNKGWDLTEIGSMRRSMEIWEVPYSWNYTTVFYFGAETGTLTIWDDKDRLVCAA